MSTCRITESESDRKSDSESDRTNERTNGLTKRMVTAVYLDTAPNVRARVGKRGNEQ